MNWYFYWYYTIYSIYKRFSRDVHFDVFATSLFSFFVASILFSFIVYLSIIFDFVDFMKISSFTIIIPCLCVFVVNYLVFLPKQRQLRNYDKFLEIQTNTKNFISILLSFFSVSALVFSIILARKYT